MSDCIENIRSAVATSISVLGEGLADEANEIFLRLRPRKPRSCWTRKWISRRTNLGASKLLEELATEDVDSFRNHLRMSELKFEELLKHVAPRIQKLNTRMRMALPAKIKLQITLRYLATGDSFSSLQYLYRVPKCTISKFVPEMCEAIYEALIEYLKGPTSEEEWQEIMQGFSSRWNFPRCCGSIDGKHVSIRCPSNSGSDFYNYKGSFSTILFAVVDDAYCFTYIDIGTNGRVSDGGVLAKSGFQEAIDNKKLKLPANALFVADDEFPLREYIMKPYNTRSGPLTIKQKVFNYRLSRARRIVENAFGILAARFRIFERPIPLSPDKVDSLVKASVAIHNWLRITSPGVYFYRGCVDEENIDTGEIVPGSWRRAVQNEGLVSVKDRSQPRNPKKAAKEVRDKLADWFMGKGSVPWQLQFVNDKAV
ncbi:uncharacterized protein LOC124356515 [Homalodisca vitripennis]|uniref:uncharacterized protein LOC124356515 n=1 Tax=Homalodisca vitripennis TaxID=197043 RepID=UPI001EEB1486|nr:uncharacterized protein LOC124356515 [Homalodisca vitripennis]